MSRCPFWSNNKEKVSCNNECPMHSISDEDDLCPFVEHLSNKIIFKDIQNDEFAYLKENIYDFDIIKSYSKY